ncbi:MAG: hypothetical protein KJP00_03335 [Bacteroidia bacterium]|nr:hypothetical protein [Bacteroidia bacterium]
MNKFILITVGFTLPTPEMMQEWMQWFKSIGDRIVEQVGLSSGKEVTKAGLKDLPMNEQALTGYLVIEAENLDEAIKIAEACPMVTSTLVYEVRSHGA